MTRRRRPGRPRRDNDAADGGRGLGGRRADPPLRAADLAVRRRRTDANRFALRLARHVTGRPEVAGVRLVLPRHGRRDARHAGRRRASRGRDGRSAPPVDPAITTAVVPFNDVDAVATGPGRRRHRLRARRAGADEHRHRASRARASTTRCGALTRETGTLLVIDETHTICAGPGGVRRPTGSSPTCSSIGKPIGGGVPAAAYGLSAPRSPTPLRADFADPSIDVSGIGGTLAGNALSVAAMRAALSSTLREEDFAVADPARRAVHRRRRRSDRRPRPAWHVQRLGVGPSTGSARRRATAPRRPPPATPSWRPSSTSTR